jgi:NifU-like protein involved in Fe-S cluster formation
MADSPEALTYNSLVHSLFAQRERAGRLDPGDNVVRGEAGSATQGVQVCFWLEIEDGRIRCARFEAYGCPHIVAAASYVAGWAEGKTTDDLLAWEWRGLADSLQAPIEKWGRFLILQDALRAGAREAGKLGSEEG